MEEGIRTRALALLAVAACACSSVETNAAPPAEAPGRAELETVNAVPTDEAGVYLVGRVLERVDRVELVGPSGEARGSLSADAWSYDDTTGEIRILVPVDDAEDLVVVEGPRAFPWVWRMPGTWREDSVRVLLDAEAGVRGEDFEVDAERRIVRFLRPELCVPETRYLVVYELAADPAHPGAVQAVSFGNHRDAETIRRFLGPPEVEAAAAETPDSGPEKGRTLQLNQALEPGSVKVVVGDRRLVEGEGFTVDYATGALTVLDAEFLAGGSEYFVSAGNLAVGNYRDMARLTELLED